MPSRLDDAFKKSPRRRSVLDDPSVQDLALHLLLERLCGPRPVPRHAVPGLVLEGERQRQGAFRILPSPSVDQGVEQSPCEPCPSSLALGAAEGLLTCRVLKRYSEVPKGPPPGFVVDHEQHSFE